MNHSFRRQLAVAVLAAGLGGAVAAVVVATTVPSKTTTVVREVVGSGTGVSSTSSSTTASSKTGSGVNAVYRSASPGVVEIVVTTGGGSTDFPFGQGQESKAQGSGWVYDTDGHIITNHHVVAGATSVHVRFSDGTVHPATVVASDPSTDLAVIKVSMPASQLHPLSLGDSNKVQVGDGVVAIGSPFGLQNTVTWGIVSALHRQMTAPSGFYENAIQTDAAVNHGNSGGPLLNMAGQVIGVNTQIESDSGGNEGVAFAVPSATIRTIVGQILSTGKVEHAFLGVKIQSVPAQAAAALGLQKGAEVTSVTAGTAAAKAGLHGSTSTRSFQGDQFDIGGDVITKVDDQSVSSSNDLSAAIDSHKPGDTITLTVVRNGATRTVQVTLGTRPTKVGG
jgi:S1-C subfamily serine protease